ncbi:Na+/H+ antiporter subunit E [Thioalkalicoccus limnaeus]|uniref:Na+/H+ antiporter subunit E n=1 Tax=Thioalkalicoccus limnaeus TaxID=120681 RepID=A0ABV4BF01_9GAMM
MIRRWLPHPLLTLTLILTWLFLVNDISVAHLLLGTLFGVLIPLFTAPFWPERPRLLRPLVLVRFLVVVLGDIVIANLQVARLVLGPTERLRPAFIELPLDLTDPFAITILASTVSLTPGTVSADVSPDRRFLLIHSLDTEDPEALIARIKARYEAPLKEMIG